MTRKKSTTPEVSAKAAAKIEIVGKASYARKRTTTEVIPPDVIRAKNSAWLDLVSPLTEWAGLKGDELRFKRAQLRLQREDVLAEIVNQARDKIGKIEQKQKPIPNKFLIPFLERASLEDPDSSLIDMWASLLASAAQNFSSHHTHFVSIISQISPKQGEILKSIIGTENSHSLELAMDSIHTYFSSHEIRKSIKDSLSKLNERTDEKFCELISSFFNNVGIEVVHASTENISTKDYYEIDFEYSAYKDSDEIDYSILEAIGLIRRVETGFFDVRDWSLSVIYYHLTYLGYYFSVACQIVQTKDK